ncbi:MAG: DEAD/DEAH box helicase family protein [Armatimonadetes bacterium]|nr:DEAD/DEAH box helicase family protein [Armatimonadota bacterium]
MEPLPQIVFDRPVLERLQADLLAGRTLPLDWRDLRHQAEALSLTPGFDQLIGLELNRIDEYPHQIEAARRVLREMRGRALLADEVGLGKTIEAGLVMKEYLLRGLARRVLILTPPSLVSQWQEEMATKFDEDFFVVERPEDWEIGDRVLGSLDTAKQPRHAERILTQQWDLLIVDEAHRLKNRNTRAWQLVNDIRRRCLLLLTATPVQNDLRELYNLVTLLKPGQLGSYRRFRARYVDPKDPRKPLNLVRLRALLSECMIRNRRSKVAVKFPPRHAYLYNVSFSPEERALYEQVSDFARHVARRGVDVLTGIILQQQACSSAAALASTLASLAENPAYPEAFRKSCGELATRASAIDQHAKAAAVVRIAREARDRVLVFTDFRATQEVLVSALREKGIEAVAFHGSLSAGEKDEAVARFRTEVPVMVSTESGGEGRNLQFCNVLVNHDLPWNPMRLEQRIGRLHRLGQTRDVYVFNLAAERTLEAVILDLLARKLRMFELVIGELDLVLGLTGAEESFEQVLAHTWREAEDEADCQRRVAELGDRLVAARERFGQIKEAELLVSQILES